MFATARQINYLRDLLPRAGLANEGWMTEKHRRLRGAHPWNADGTVGDWLSGLTRSTASALIDDLLQQTGRG